MNDRTKPTNSAQEPTDERPEEVTDNNLEDGLEELEAAEEAAAESTQEKDDDKEEKEPPTLEYEADPRDEIEEAFFDKQKDAEKEQPADAKSEEEEQPTQEAETDDGDEVIEAKVDGKVEKITRTELEKRLADYQRYGTAEKRLQEASELLKQAKELKSAEPAKEPTDQRTDESDSSTEDAGKNADELLAKVGEKLQFGSTEEVVDALKTVISEAQRGQKDTSRPEFNPESVTSAVLEVQEQQRSKEALQRFESENKDLDTNPRLQTLMRHEVSDIMKADIRDTMVSRGLTEDDINQVDTLTEQQIVQAHRALRVNGGKARDTSGILVQAKDNLVKANLWPGASKAAGSQDRAARKQSAQQQPASRTSPTQGQTQQRRPAVQSTSDIVAEENAARGNAV